MTTETDMKALDLWHAGLPYGAVGESDDTTLDIWSDGAPIILSGPPPPTASARPVVFVVT